MAGLRPPLTKLERDHIRKAIDAHVRATTNFIRTERANAMILDELVARTGDTRYKERSRTAPGAIRDVYRLDTHRQLDDPKPADGAAALSWAAAVSRSVRGRIAGTRGRHPPRPRTRASA